MPAEQDLRFRWHHLMRFSRVCAPTIGRDDTHHAKPVFISPISFSPQHGYLVCIRTDGAFWVARDRGQVGTLEVCNGAHSIKSLVRINCIIARPGRSFRRATAFEGQRRGGRGGNRGHTTSKRASLSTLCSIRARPSGANLLDHHPFSSTH